MHVSLSPRKGFSASLAWDNLHDGRHTDVVNCQKLPGLRDHLITFVEMLRRRGLSTREAILQGGRSRVRPILMTAFATIFALIPLSLGLSRGGIIIAEELATVVIGGLFTSTLLTLVVIPVVYSLYDDLGRWLRRGRETAAGGVQGVP